MFVHLTLSSRRCIAASGRSFPLCFRLVTLCSRLSAVILHVISLALELVLNILVLKEDRLFAFFSLGHSFLPLSLLALAGFHSTLGVS